MVYSYPVSLVALLAAGLPLAMGWGAMGHEAVAYVATRFVASETESYFQDLLGDTSNDYLGSVAAWADSFSHSATGKFSAHFHYIDARDDPPSSCGVSLDRDCADGCVVSAIANYTSRILDLSVGTLERQIAAKMVIHLIGDVGQPLHCEALDKGGNGIDVDFDGDGTNLHHVWDTEIPEIAAGGSSTGSAKRWALSLVTDIKSGAYKSQAAGWASNINITDAENAALAWATESNAHVCTTVLRGGANAVAGRELSSSYIAAGRPVVSEQIAKQGYRLAKWLDAIAAAASQGERV